MGNKNTNGSKLKGALDSATSELAEANVEIDVLGACLERLGFDPQTVTPDEIVDRGVARRALNVGTELVIAPTVGVVGAVAPGLLKYTALLVIPSAIAQIAGIGSESVVGGTILNATKQVGLESIAVLTAKLVGEGLSPRGDKYAAPQEAA